MTELLAIIAMSLAGSVHCVGMCGGLAAAIGTTNQRLTRALVRQLAYTLGRIGTYAFLGAVGGFAGLTLSQYETTLIGAQQVFSILAGLLMILISLPLLGWGSFLNKGPVGGIGRLIAPMFNHFLNARGMSGCFTAGLATGFLPCGFVYAFLAKAVATCDVSRGLAVMACFGLGTAPAMLMIGCGSTLLSQRLRVRISRLAAVFLIIMGGVMIYRAIPRGGEPGCHTQATFEGPRDVAVGLGACPRA